MSAAARLLGAIVFVLVVGLSSSVARAENLQFQTPSGNIGCEYQPDADDRLYCIRLEPVMSYIEFYAKGAYTGDYEGDSWFPANAPELPYGESQSFGPYDCTSAKSGLTCERGKHGFSASRAGIEVF